MMKRLNSEIRIKFTKVEEIEEGIQVCDANELNMELERYIRQQLDDVDVTDIEIISSEIVDELEGDK